MLCVLNSATVTSRLKFPTKHSFDWISIVQQILNARSQKYQSDKYIEVIQNAQKSIHTYLSKALIMKITNFRWEVEKGVNLPWTISKWYKKCSEIHEIIQLNYHFFSKSAFVSEIQSRILVNWSVHNDQVILV